MPGPAVLNCNNAPNAPSGSTTISSAPTSTAAPSPAPTSGTGAPLYGQCGGSGWTGPTTCAQGSCKATNEWYSEFYLMIHKYFEKLIKKPRPMCPLNLLILIYSPIVYFNIYVPHVQSIILLRPDRNKPPVPHDKAKICNKIVNLGALEIK